MRWLLYDYRYHMLHWISSQRNVHLNGESLFLLRYTSNMPASRIGFHMTLPEVAALDIGSEKLLEKIKPIMLPPDVAKDPTPVAVSQPGDCMAISYKCVSAFVQ